jgi:hypothetical protein
MKSNSIDNSADILDSRDIVARIEALQEEREALAAGIEEVSGDDAIAAAAFALSEWRANGYEAELQALQALAAEAEGYAPDWQYGEALIRDSYFITYAQELADDIGAIDANASWPNSYIDWDRAARALKMDYTAVDFAGVTYWIRG